MLAFHSPQGELTPPRETTPPPSENTTLKPDEPRSSIEDPSYVLFARDWKPLALSVFKKPTPEQLSKIPNLDTIVSFHPDFLRNIFGGVCWSPGLNYVPPSPGPCLLKNRTYYTLDAEFEPYLPRVPGIHGAKLTAFFNESPEDHYNSTAAGNSYDSVPLFICNNPTLQAHKQRYVYFGHYTQARWSDKLDYDRMVEAVPHKVKEYWAEELSAQGRPAWVTQQLMRHFWPRPEYEGRMPGGEEWEEGTEEEDAVGEKVLKDVKNYIRELRLWEKDAGIKVGLIKKDFILKAFERVRSNFASHLRIVF
jgi:hypothetical protein